MGITGRVILFLFLFVSIGVSAQDTKKDSFYDFKKEIESAFMSQKEADQLAYRKFRDEVNAKYAEFLKKTWGPRESEPVAPMPQEEPVFPVQPVVPEKTDTYSEKSEPLPYNLVITLPEPIKQPQPVVPIFEVPNLNIEWFDFEFYGTNCQVRIDERHRFEFSTLDGFAISEQWKNCSGELYDNLIRDCLELRMKMKLCDYAYLQMLDVLCDEFLGEDTNESVFLRAFLYCQSGYKMRLAIADGENRLVMSYSTHHTIYGAGVKRFPGGFYLYDNTDQTRFAFCDVPFDGEQPLSLIINSSPVLAEYDTEERKIESSRYINMSFVANENKNLIDFYNTYPISTYSGNQMTQWSIYANTPVSETVEKSLYAPMKERLEGLSPYDAVSYLLNWVQTGFDYEVDQKVWGAERIFFMEETLYYPYCDCEDRSILFTRMVRDLLGLDALLVGYPGHLAAAVAFPEAVNGDWFLYEDKKYVVCDPTYLGASIGVSMPQYRGVSAGLIKLD